MRDFERFLIAEYLKEILTDKVPPPEFELIPIGIYNGVDLPGTVILDDSYIVYMEVENSEFDCEVN